MSCMASIVHRMFMARQQYVRLTLRGADLVLQWRIKPAKPHETPLGAKSRDIDRMTQVFNCTQHLIAPPVKHNHHLPELGALNRGTLDFNVSRRLTFITPSKKSKPILPNPSMSPRTLFPVAQDAVTDWGGRIIPKAMIDHLFPSCVVRVVVTDSESKWSEALYFRITKIKDGTFWGETMNTYRMSTLCGGNEAANPIPLKEGEQFTWRREHINEIPLEKFLNQPKRYMKLVSGLKGKYAVKGYAITGLRGSVD